MTRTSALGGSNWAVVIALLASISAGAQSTPTPEFKVGAHIHSRFSHGSTESIATIADYAQQTGIDALLLTDTAIAQWNYGIPFTGFEWRQKQDSILKLGPENYLREVKEAARTHPSVLLIPGTEAAAFYRWSGKPWSKLILHDWHRHILLMGLHDPQDYDGLPILGNRQAYRFQWFTLWPFTLFLLAFCAKRADLFLLSKVFYAIGIVFLISLFPFKSFPWSQYEHATPWQPYRDLVRYGKAHGALVFLAHPEAPTWSQPVAVTGHVSVQTDPYPEGLKAIPELDGFSVFMEGDKTMSEPGRAWDEALEGFCSGQRSKAPWGISELDYKGKGISDTFIDTDYMVVRAPSKTEPAILGAISAGSFYSVEPSKVGAMKLNTWEASSRTSVARAGQTLQAKNRARLTVALSFLSGLANARVRIIRNGKTIIDENRPLPASWTLDEPVDACSFYRVIAYDSTNGSLASNPIFIRAIQARSR